MDRLIQDRGLRGEKAKKGVCEGKQEDAEYDPQTESEPDAIHTLTEGCGGFPRSDQPRGAGGRRVGEEDTETDDGGENRLGEGEAGERMRAQVPHHGRIHGDQQGFRKERAERRNRQSADF